ncbi:Putative 50S ribosomal protein YmL27 [Aspergillus calidoustus]|uniref:Putative 50S ribosomal protein YmL27 n=1 Tax=Aspergillus calidoustus TaxID=454130 RepID=A0A0U5G5N9_ASPCI|nr:Putative 50S ribosomal protein YmL27 [Aspergillus calidoustus]
MVRPTQPMMARLRLTTKQVNGGYYKGNRTGSMGYFAKNGSYIIDWKKVRTYNVPENLADFKLTPFVTKLMPPTKSKYFKEIQRNGKTVSVEKGFQAEDYLELWASDNGPEVLEYERKDQRRAEYARARQEYERQKAERAGPSEQGAGTP